MTSDGTATVKLTLGVGSYSIKAEFLGFGLSPASFSAVQAVTVTSAANYVSLSGIAVSGSAGNYALTGTVTAFGRVPPTGTVSFIDTSDSNAVVGTAALNAGTLATVFNPAPESPLEIGDGVGFVATGDFNNDGIPDVAWINESGGSIVYVSL